MCPANLHFIKLKKTNGLITKGNNDKCNQMNKQRFTLEEFGVYEELQREEKHHQDDAGHQDTVETGAEQTDLPQGHSTATAGLQPVGPDARNTQKTKRI